MPRQRRRTKTSTSLAADAPNGATVVRMMHLLPGHEALVDTVVSKLATDPKLQDRDGPVLARIAAARNLGDLLDLASSCQGLAEFAWLRRFKAFSLGAAPILEAYLMSVAKAPEGERDLVEQMVIIALHECGRLGSEVLLRAWPTLSDAGAGLAAMVLGLHQVHAAADGVWALYQRLTANSALDNEALAALWGLADLQDPRAGRAAYGHYLGGATYCECETLIILAGDGALCVECLRGLTAKLGQPQADSLKWIFIGLAQRLGRETVLEALTQSAVFGPTSIELMGPTIDRLLALPPEVVWKEFPLLAPTLLDPDNFPLE